MGMAAGSLDRQVTLEYPAEVQDAAGELTKQWQRLPFRAATWARKEDLDGRELFQAQQINAQVTTRFTLRYRTDVDARMRVCCDDVLYPIHAVLEGPGRRRWTVLLCSRSAN